tara:strand:- start:109 stop:528 length:420 start_codon:yes stop_codon:yes gene_type:complete
MKLTLIAAFAAIAGLASAGATPEKEDGRKHRGHPGIKQLIEKFDKDGDGKLNAEERKAAGEARKAEFLKRFDKDGDGKISPEEKKAAAEEMKKRFGDRRRPGGGNRPEGRKPRPDHKKPEGRKPRPDHKKPGKRPAKKK